MKQNPVVAIVGATGLVGSEMLATLEQRKFVLSELRLLASAGSAGEVYRYGSDEYSVDTLSADSFAGVDIALFATSGELASKFVPCALEAGAYVIDNSSHFRMNPEVPLVVPEVNWNSVKPKDRLIANPNCSTIQLVPVLNAMHQAAGLKRVVVSTYQAVSGAGKAALDELWAQTLAIFNQKEIETEAFQHQIAFNCIPQIDVLLENGYTKEEFKIINESRKILGLPDLRITATAVRVPVFHSHAESVNVELEKEIDLPEMLKVLEKAPGVVLYPEIGEYPLQLEVASTDEIHLGRVRRDRSVACGYDMWIVADNVRKGAALNAVQIAECLIKA